MDTTYGSLVEYQNELTVLLSKHTTVQVNVYIDNKNKVFLIRPFCNSNYVHIIYEDIYSIFKQGGLHIPYTGCFEPIEISFKDAANFLTVLKLKNINK